jgi:hypothetical protein
MLCLRHDFYNIIFKIKQIIYSLRVSPPPPPKAKLWVRTCAALCAVTVRSSLHATKCTATVILKFAIRRVVISFTPWPLYPGETTTQLQLPNYNYPTTTTQLQLPNYNYPTTTTQPRYKSANILSKCTASVRPLVARSIRIGVGKSRSENTVTPGPGDINIRTVCFL